MSRIVIYPFFMNLWCLWITYQAIKAASQETGSVWSRYGIGIDEPCVYTGPDRSALDGCSYPVPNGFTFESGSVWNLDVPGWYAARVKPAQ